MLSSSFDGAVRVHGLRSSKMLKEFRGHKSYVNCAIYSMDGAQVYSASSDGSVRVWDAKTCECLSSFKCGPLISSRVAVTDPVVAVSLLPRFCVSCMPVASERASALSITAINRLLHYIYTYAYTCIYIYTFCWMEPSCTHQAPQGRVQVRKGRTQRSTAVPQRSDAVI